MPSIVCPLTGRRLQPVPISSVEAFCFNHRDLGEYWLSLPLFLAFTEGHIPQLNDQEKNVIAKQIINRNDEGLVPFFCFLESEPSRTNEIVTQNPRMVFVDFETAKKQAIDDSAKEMKLLQLLSVHYNQLEKSQKFTNIPARARISIGIFSTAEYAQWISYLYHKQLVALDNNPLFYLKRRDDDDFKASLSPEYDVIALTSEGWSEIQKLK